MKPANMDDLHGDTVVSKITISMFRSGVVKVDGQITDLEYALVLLDTARDVVKSYHARLQHGNTAGIIVPAHDTALVGTEQEKLLLKARDELSNAMAS